MGMKQLKEVPGSLWWIGPKALSTPLAFLEDISPGLQFRLILLLVPYKGGTGRSLRGHLRKFRWWLFVGHRQEAQKRLLGKGFLVRQCGQKGRFHEAALCSCADEPADAVGAEGLDSRAQKMIALGLASADSCWMWYVFRG